jgi:hypothetical protein
MRVRSNESLQLTKARSAPHGSMACAPSQLNSGVRRQTEKFTRSRPLMRAVPLQAFAILVGLAPVVAVGQATRPGSYYVAVPVLEERTAPEGPVVNRIYRGQRVDVTQVRAGWARVTDLQYDARWVRAASLSTKRPPDLPQKPVPASLRDPRIEKDAIPKAGEGGLTQRDVDVLWKGAAYMLRTGRCSKVTLAHKSVSRPGTYYVSCGGSQNVFFTEADIR